MLSIAYCPLNGSCKVGKIAFNGISDHLKSVHASSVKHVPKAIESNETLNLIYAKHQKESQNHFWCNMIKMNTSHQQQVGDVAVLPAKDVQSRPCQVRFYSVSMLDEKGNFNSWVYIHGSPHDAKRFAYTFSLIGRQSNYSYYGFVKSLNEESRLITSEGHLLFIQKNAFNTSCRTGKKEDEWECDVEIHDLQEKAKEKNDGVKSDVKGLKRLDFFRF